MEPLLFAMFNLAYGLLRAADIQNISNGSSVFKTFCTAFLVMVVYVAGMRYGINGILGENYLLYGFIWCITSSSAGTFVMWRRHKKEGHK
jgi:hypothetical protein